jgi:hypothetical protein
MLYDKKWEWQAKNKPARRILLGAAEIIEQRGWCQGDFQDGNGRVCMLGAISISSVSSPMGEAGNAIVLLGLKSVTQWNDTPGRTKEEVVARLRTAAHA